MNSLSELPRQRQWHKHLLSPITSTSNAKQYLNEAHHKVE